MKINSSFISLCLSLVGGILLISSLIDYLFLVFPLQFQEQGWQINITNSLVDRGIVPLVGISLLLIGWWIYDNNINGKSLQIIRLPVFIISSILGLIFLLLVPLHLGNMNSVSGELMAQINQKVSQQQAQIQGFVAQLDAIAKNPEQLKQEIEQRNQVINAGGVIQGQQLEPQQLELLTSQRDQLQQMLDLSQKPEELKAKLQEVETRLQNELKEVENNEIKKAQSVALKQSLRTSINSLMLSIAYIVIGWLGLQMMMIKSNKVTE
ncbi:HpsJ family protein [Geminocystis sp. CENA526]|uniref:HpsJ family protein n=1 Tax=Geminocystis sp. CENA526 TaxID=1355871 RepID=UPI003D6FAAAC